MTRRALDVGEHVGPYLIVRRLGAGGGGEVFAASDTRGAGDVALKWVPPQSPQRVALEAMLRDEARLGPMLRHSNIVETLGLVAHRGSVVLVMEFAGAGSLAARRGCAAPLDVALGIGRTIALALHHAHSACDTDGQPLGLVHRDVSPHNLLFSGTGRPKLGDFGIALARGRHQRTATGFVKGKARYVAPEVIGGERAADRRADVYSLGVVTAELALGAPLTGSASLAELIDRKLRGDIDPDGQLQRLPAAARAAVLAATAPRPDDRLVSGQALADALGAAGAADEAAIAAWALATVPTENLVGLLDEFVEPLDEAGDRTGTLVD